MKISVVLALGLLFLVPALSATALAAEPVMPQYDLRVVVDPSTGSLSGLAKINLPPRQDGEPWAVRMDGLRATSITLDNAPLPLGTSDRTFLVNASGMLKIQYTGEFAPSLDSGLGDPNAPVRSVISNDAVSLTGGWYPAIGGLARYSLSALLPPGFEAVSEAEDITAREVPGGFEFSFSFPYPLDGLSLAAGRYMISAGRAAETDIYTYFFEADADLAQSYIQSAAGYIEDYTALIGPYPYKRFSIVENVLPTGYAMPTFTLLGRDIVRLPFMLRTSLGHEILHQWFGNSVYADLSGGNWLEGLTSYLADHRFDELKGEGWLYRKKILTDYGSYVRPDNAIALVDFRQRVDFSTRSVGYGKGAMFFHMLKQYVGDEVFYAALRRFVQDNRFRAASWDDLREKVQAEAGEDLQWFFKQWLNRKDLPGLGISALRLTYVDGVPTISFKLRQTFSDKEAGPYRFGLKLDIETDERTITKTLRITEAEEDFIIPVQGTPRELVFDPDYDLMRQVTEAESPATVARLLGTSGGLLIMPAEDTDTYAPLISVFRGRGFQIKTQGEMTDEELRTSSVVLLGEAGPQELRLFGSAYETLAPPAAPETSEAPETPEPPEPPSGFVLSVRKNPFAPDKIVALARAADKAEAAAAARKLLRYGKYSLLRFSQGRNTQKERDPSQRGIRRSMLHRVAGVRPAQAVGLQEVINNVIDRPVIYVGESHTNYEDHRVQIEVIRALWEDGRKFGIGMEMFQRKFQPALDDYIEGRSTAKEFLRASEYFKRWKFDYHQYREIVDFARAKGISLVALNADTDIIQKVSRGGLDALSAEQREAVPPDMDMSDAGYRKRLQGVFLMHKDRGKKKFDDFYQSQVLWDETMAHGVDDFMRENPGYQMVVLAGVGHVLYGSGIPERAYRLNGKDYAVLINSNIETIEPGMADYILFPERLTAPPSVKLGVYLAESNGDVTIQKFAPGSPAQRAGMKTGDIIHQIDETEIKSVADLKVALFGLAPEATVQVRASRKRMLFGRKMMQLSVTFSNGKL